MLREPESNPSNRDEKTANRLNYIAAPIVTATFTYALSFVS